MPQESVESTLGERFKEVRKDFGYNQQDFAVFLNITQGAISKIENNESGLSLEVVDKIITELHISFDWLIHGTGHKLKGANSTPAEKANQWREAQKIVDEAIETAGAQDRLNKSQIGLMVSFVFPGVAAGLPLGEVRQQLAELIAQIAAKAPSKES